MPHLGFRASISRTTGRTYCGSAARADIAGRCTDFYDASSALRVTLSVGVQTEGFVRMDFAARKTIFSFTAEFLGLAGGLMSACTVLISLIESVGHALIKVRPSEYSPTRPGPHSALLSARHQLPCVSRRCLRTAGQLAGKEGVSAPSPMRRPVRMPEEWLVELHKAISVNLSGETIARAPTATTLRPIGRRDHMPALVTPLLSGNPLTPAYSQESAGAPRGACAP